MTIGTEEQTAEDRPLDTGTLSTADLPAQWSAQITRLTAIYRLPLTCYFERRGATHAEAEELTQEVFLRLVQRPQAASIENLEPYIFRTATNLLRDTARRHRVRERDQHVTLSDQSDSSTAWAGFAPSPEVQTEGKRRLRAVTDAIQSLSPKCRQIFMLHRFDGLAHSEIAELRGISVSAVEKHIARAMIHLKASLDRADGGRP